MPHPPAQRDIHIFAILAAPLLMLLLLLATGLAGRGAQAHEGEVHECGNGVQEGHEQCDDGNLIDDDGCTNLCTCEIGEDKTTFEAIQSVVFDSAVYQCSNAVCHNPQVPGKGGWISHYRRPTKACSAWTRSVQILLEAPSSACCRRSRRRASSTSSCWRRRIPSGWMSAQSRSRHR